MYRHLRSTGLSELASDTLSETLPALGISIPKTIFCIEASNDGLVLIPHKDFVLSYNRYIIKRNMPIENEDYFFYSNLLSFHAVKFGI